MTGFMRLSLALALCGALGAGQALAFGGGGGTSAKEDNPDYAQAVKLVDAGDYARAIPLLEKSIANVHLRLLVGYHPFHELRRTTESYTDCLWFA